MRATIGLLAVAGFAAAAAARVEIPIRQAVMPSGDIRYSIAIRVGDTPVEAMLDTGSAGLRILPGVLKDGDAAKSSESSSASYNSGVVLDGVAAKAIVALDSAVSPAPIRFAAVEAVHCTDRKPDCPAVRIPPAQYRIGGGAPGSGFMAIFGINFRYSPDPNPLVAMGIARWIVVLPRPGEAAPGTLILDPDPAETAGYALFHVDHDLGRLPGCLIRGDDKVCGGVVLDTGAMGVQVVGRQKPSSFPWPDGSHVTLAFKPDRGEPFGSGFDIRRAADSPTRLRWDDEAARDTFIRAGILPYFAYSVLYDASSDTIGLKAR